MKSQVPNAVAYPPKLLFAPAELVALNVAVTVALFLLSQVLFNFGPAPVGILFAAVHIVLAITSAREPHLVSLLRAGARAKHSSRNLVPIQDGVKYVP
jgi:hypothetical protein